MPEVGNITRGTDLGFRNHNQYIIHRCINCGKERWVMLIRGQPENVRCRSCAMRGRRGNRGHNWQGGRIILARGYVQVLLTPDNFFYPMTNKDGYVMEHRLVVAKYLGRNLHLWEIVHHKGAKYPKGSKEDKADNRYPENLQLVTDDRHKQITILENRIDHLETRVTMLEAENMLLREMEKRIL